MLDLFRNQGFFLEKEVITGDALSEARDVTIDELKSAVLCSNEKHVFRIPAAYSQIPNFRPLIQQAMKSNIVQTTFKGRQLINFSLYREPFKGYGAQEVHRDSNGINEELIGFISLDTIDTKNGPLKLRPYSHRHNCEQDVELIAIGMGPGDIIWYDPRIEHCGTNNVSGNTRRAIIISITSEVLHPCDLLDERNILRQQKHTADDLKPLFSAADSE